MFKEAAILNSRYGLHHAWRNLVVGNEASLDSVLIFRKCCDELRLQLVSRQRCTIFGGDGLYLSACRVDGCAIGCKVALGARFDQDVIATELVAAQLRVAVVAGFTKRSGNVLCGELLPCANLLGSSVNLRDGGK